MKRLITTTLILVCFLNLTFSQTAKIDSLKNVIKTSKIDTVILKAYLLLSDKIKYQHPDATKKEYQEAIAYANKHKSNLTIAGLYNNRAISFGVNSQNDSCVDYLKKAIKLYTEVDSLLPQIGSAYGNIGGVYRRMGYFDLAIQYNLKSVMISKKSNDSIKLALRLGNLAATYHDMDAPKQSLVYALQSYELFKTQAESYYKVNNLIALGSIYSELNLLDSAYYYALESKKMAEKLQYITAMPDIYNNLGYIFEEQKKYNQAKDQYNNSISYCDSLKNEDFKFYPFWHLASIFRLEMDYKQSKIYITKILDFANNLDNLSYKVKAYKETYEYYKAIKDYSNSLKYLELFKQWSDTLLNTSKQDKISELNIIYETTLKEQQILLQQKENMLQKNEIEKQKTRIGIILTIAFILIIFTLLFLYIRSQKQKREILKLQINTKDKTLKEVASELHTGVGSELAAIILQLENNRSCSDEVERIKKIYRQVRNSSHILNLPDFIVSSIEDEIQNMVTNFKTSNIEIDVQIYSKTGWKNVSSEIQKNIYRIVQELFSNTMKHAGASHIEVQLLKQEKQISLTFEDNGKGYNPSEIIKTNGYQTELISRTQFLNGSVNDDSKIGTGAILNFTFPI